MDACCCSRCPIIARPSAGALAWRVVRPGRNTTTGLAGAASLARFEGEGLRYAMPVPTDDDAIIEKAEASLISTKPGAVPPHLDIGGHLPFGGTTHNGTGGRSAFGKRKIVTSAGTGNNPRALLLNYPPPPTEANIRCWEVNYK